MSVERHEIVVEESVYRREPRYQARCVTCGIGLHKPSTMRSRADLVESAHQYAMELLTRDENAETGRIVVDLPPPPVKVVRVARYRGECPVHRKSRLCGCVRGCAVCSGCSCSCECYVCA